VVRHSFEGDAQRPGRHPTERPGERDEPQRLGPAPAPAIDAA
jgi:hypothetical protein